LRYLDLRRRDKALIAIFIPIFIISFLKIFYPLSYHILYGYMVAIVLIFKSSILSIWLASKLKILTFLKTLTLYKGVTLAIKRWFIDNLLSKWLQKHIFSHLSLGIKEAKEYYQAMSFKAKVKNTLLFLFPITIVTWFMYVTEMLTHAALYAELKVLISGFFKLIWLLAAKLLSTLSIMIGWISGSWIAPILEIFALSYLLDFLEKKLGKDNPITKFFTIIGNLLNRLLEKIGILQEKHLAPIIERTVTFHSKKLGEKLSNFIKEKKIAQEFLYFDNLQNIILQGHINAYHHFKDMDTIKDKKILYQRINQETDDNITIIAYISRNKKGELLEEQVSNSYYHDIFFLKGIASSETDGVKEHLEEQIDYTDFWILNTSRYPVTLKSSDANYHDRVLQGKSLTLIKTKHTFNPKTITCEYLDKNIHPTPL
jgi:hypothetical protein